jgi:hypothetical protein
MIGINQQKRTNHEKQNRKLLISKSAKNLE